MKWPVEKKIAGGFGLLLTILIIIGVVSFQSTFKFIETSRLETKTRMILKKLEIVLTEITNAETGQRGYIITGDERYLVPYHAAVANIDREVEDLSKLIRDNPDHQRKLNALKPLLAEKLKGLNERIDLRKNKGFEAAAKEVGSGKGRIAMDKIRKIITEVEDGERELLKQESADVEASANRTIFIIIFGSSLAFVIVGIASIVTHKELSKRNRAEEALQESEERFRSIYEESPIGIELYDSTGRLLNVNKACLDIFGVIDAEEVKGFKLLDDPNLPEEYKHNILKGESVRFESLFDFEKVKAFNLYKTKKSGIIYVDTVITPLIPAGQERIMGYLVQVQDITERKRADEELKKAYAELEQKVQERTAELSMINESLQGEITEHKQAEKALRESEAMFRALSETVASAVSILQGEKFRYVNPAMEAITGYTQEELLAMNFWDVAHPDFRELIRERGLARQRGEPVPSRHEVKIVTKNGEERWVDYAAAAIEFKGSPGVLATAFDITERKQAEEELKTALREWRATVDSTTDLIMLLDSETKIIKANLATTRFLNRPFNEILGKNCIQLFCGENRPPAACPLEKMKMTRKHEESEFYSSERGIWIMASVDPIFNDKGNLTGSVYIIRDITGRKIAEEKLLAYQKQLQSLASQLSITEERERHRIATDLHDHIGQTLALCQIKLGALRESASPTLAVSVDGIRDLIDQTIQYTRSLTSELSPPILYELGFEAAVEWLGEQILTRHGIQFYFENDGQNKPMTDEARVLLFQTVREFMVNVVKHAQARNSSVYIRRDGNNIQIKVEDDGVGFDISKLDSYLKGNSGFGLFSIRERLNSIRGYLNIESGPGKGSRFTVVAPLKI